MSAWGTNAPAPAAWGTQVEEEEAKGGVLGPPSAVFGGSEAFPTLGEVGKVSKKDKRKKAVSLAEFQSGTSTARGSAFVPSAARQPAPSYEVDLNSLPTGPRERSAEEADRSGGLGGAFTRGGATFSLIGRTHPRPGHPIPSCPLASNIRRYQPELPAA